MVQKYLSLVKFSHTVFALPFALVGLSVGLWQVMPLAPLSGREAALKLLWVVVCMVTARNAAMAFNRWADRHWDAQNARTALREIPAGLISARAALGFALVNGALFVVAAGMLNTLCLFLSPVALAVVMGYSYTKRFTALCHLVLGVGLGLAPVGAHLAVTGRFDLAVVLLGLAVVCWVAGFDIIYALQDETFDRQNGLRSIPAALGSERALWLSRGLHLMAFGLIWLFGALLDLGGVYYLASAIFGLLLYRQHSLVRPPDLSRINLAFFTTNGIGSVVFGSLTILELARIHWGWF